GGGGLDQLALAPLVRGRQGGEPLELVGVLETHVPVPLMEIGVDRPKVDVGATSLAVRPVEEGREAEVQAPLRKPEPDPSAPGHGVVDVLALLSQLIEVGPACRVVVLWEPEPVAHVKGILHLHGGAAQVLGPAELHAVEGEIAERDLPFHEGEVRELVDPARMESLAEEPDWRGVSSGDHRQPVVDDVIELRLTDLHSIQVELDFTLQLDVVVELQEEEGGDLVEGEPPLTALVWEELVTTDELAVDAQRGFVGPAG